MRQLREAPSSRGERGLTPPPPPPGAPRQGLLCTRLDSATPVTVEMASRTIVGIGGVAQPGAVQLLLPDPPAPAPPPSPPPGGLTRHRGGSAGIAPAGHPSRPGLGSLVLCTAPGLPGCRDQRDDATPTGHDLASPSGRAPPPA